MFGALDLSLPEQRFGDGKPNRKKFTPYPDTTRARVQTALDRFPASRGSAGPEGSDYLIVQLGRNSNPRTVQQPLSTVACKPHHALVRRGPSLDECRIRMLRPHENAEIQRFPKTTKVTETMTEQYAQAGNAVPANVRHWAGARLLPGLA